MSRRKFKRRGFKRIAIAGRDNCQFCAGRQGGTRGNENVHTVIDQMTFKPYDVLACDYCSVKHFS